MAPGMYLVMLVMPGPALLDAAASGAPQMCFQGVRGPEGSPVPMVP